MTNTSRSMADWQPALYTRFERQRTQPARDLLARCEPDGSGPLSIVDLGCGPANSTALLAERFPDAETLGVDTSPAMLDAARRRLPGARFVAGDIATFTPEARADLLFSNAALQWVPDHAALYPRLFGLLKPGGILAVQVPDNLSSPAQTAMHDIAAEPRFAAHFAGGSAPGSDRTEIASVEETYDWLAADAAEIEIWHTIYRHPMESAAAITEWFSSTGLKPFVDRLPEAERPAYLERYTAEIESRYTVRADGMRLLEFPRLFVVARRRS